MDSKKTDKSVYNSFKRKHFARLHEKIQNKYEEMQKKLEKSKSVDSLSSVGDDYVYRVHRHSSTSDVSEIDEVISVEKSAHKLLKHQVIVEEVHRNDANLQYFDAEQSSVSEYELSPREKNDSITETFFGNEISTSLESLNEVARENPEFQASPTPTQTIRNKIGSRISAVKEKRRQMEKEKNAIKDKKRESLEKVEKFILSNTPNQDLIRTYKKTKLATVTIALIEAITTDLETDLDEKSRLIHCRLRLGTEKFKSKTKLFKTGDTEVKWQELINFNLYDDTILEISLWFKDYCISRNQIDLLELEKERTHKMQINLESELGHVQIFILLTISGIPLANTLVDVDDYEQANKKFLAFRKKFAWYQIKDDSPDVGWISIIVYGAKGLSGHDCYCILELNNERLQTHTEFKTNGPNWMKLFTFSVTDVTSILKVTIHDEKKSEDVGKLSIPLLRINSYEKKWYALKDPSLRERSRGSNPRILLEMRLTWNLVKASIRVINPKALSFLETEESLHRHVFARNIARAKIVLTSTLDLLKFIKTCFEWESPQLNLLALTVWIPFCWFFKIWMLPLLLLIPFVWYRPPRYFLVNWRKWLLNEKLTEDDFKKDKDEKQSLRQKIQGIQEMVQTVQNVIGEFANLGESIKNLFNFTVPFLSLLAIFLVLVIALVMFMIPTNYIFMIWGIHKFTRKILRPNRIPNNEILDLLSRVPNDELLLDCEELPLEEVPEEDVIKR